MAQAALVERRTRKGFRPWRELVTPHPDVSNGRYQQAEFAADLWQVYLGEGSAEYREPVEFFRRTFLTESLQRLLVGAVHRVAGQGGDPVVQLQTNFGGGKTHSMLALYHLFSGVAPSELAGVDGVLAEAGVKDLPEVRRVVLVGNKSRPATPSPRPTARWCARSGASWPTSSAASRRTPASPRTTRTRPAPATCCGSSSREGSPHAQADDVEVGGIRGREALDRLRNVVGRVESSWRPATAEEGFVIMRRRSGSRGAKSVERRYTGTRRMGSAAGSSRSSASWSRQ